MSDKLDLSIGWRGVPGWFSEDEAMTLAYWVRRAPPHTNVVELGSWCGRSFSVIAENLPEDVHGIALDNHLGNSQAEQTAKTISASKAKAILAQVLNHHVQRHRRVSFFPFEAVEAGENYGYFSGTYPVSVLFVDDHHSAEQVVKVMKAWGPHLAPRCTLLFHDYMAEPLYGLQAALKPLLAKDFTFKGIRDSVGVFTR